MKRLPVYLLLLLPVGSVGNEVSGQESQEKKAAIKLGASQAIAAKLRAAAERYAAKQEEVELAREAKEFKEWEAAPADTRRRLETELQRHRDYRAYKSELDLILQAKPDSSAKASPEEAEKFFSGQRQALSQLHDKYARMLREAYRKSNIDASQLVAMIAGDDKSKQSRLKNLGYLSWLEMGGGTQPPPEVPQTAFEFDAPYAEPASEEYRTGGAMFGLAEADGDEGAVWTSGGATVAGQCQTYAYLGEFITLPPGYSRIQVTARIRSDYQLDASGLLGIGRARISGYLRVVDQNAAVHDHSAKQAEAFALLVGDAHVDINEAFTVEHTFDVPSSGGACLVQAGVRSFSGAAGGAFAFNTADSNVEWIAIELLP